MSETVSSYDELPYESKPIYRTHPDGMAAIATLFGLQPPLITQCRVLELGCAGGGNLLAMAQCLPESQFVGIDLSSRQIDEGLETIKALGLKNVALKTASILDVGDDYGKFDYIVCHGVYSWVPPLVQDKILSICSKNLSANGIAYVSYNCYPGWHARGMIRDMVCYHTRNTKAPVARAREARQFLGFLARTTWEGSPYGALLREEDQLWNKVTDTYLVHEQLEDHNHPAYFYEFAERAAGHGLQYFAEAEFSPLDAETPADVRAAFDHWAESVVEWEQYLDFVRNRTFRRSLLCHAARSVRRPPSPDPVKKMYAATLARPVSKEPDLHTDAVEKFEAPDGASITTNNPLIKTAIATLFNAWPQSIGYSQLLEIVRSRLGQTGIKNQESAASSEEPGLTKRTPISDGALQHPDCGPDALAEALLHCFLSNVVELHLHPPKFALGICERPLASPLARYQARHGATRISNLCHRAMEISDVDRFVLAQLDGTRDRGALLDILKDLVAKEALTLRRNDQLVKGPADVQEFLDASLHQSLRRIAASALLVA